MSHPIRYDCNGIDGMIDARNGDYVKWDDYAALIKKNERFHNALKDVKTAWHAQRAMDIIKTVDKALETFEK